MSTLIYVATAKGAMQKCGEHSIECRVGAVGWDGQCAVA